MSTDSTRGDDAADLLADLDRLEAESRRREQELHDLADAAPAAVSRTQLVGSMVRSLRDLLPSRRSAS